VRPAARNLALLALALPALAGCAIAPKHPLPPLAHARVSADFDSYELRRVGLLPFRGHDLERDGGRQLQEAFLFELARRARYEIVLLDDVDLAEVDEDQPYERGSYRARSVVEIARRFRLDALLVGTVTHLESYAPQSLGLQLELVAAETGLVIWASGLELDSADATVRESLARYQDQQLGPGDRATDLEVTLLSPARWMRFAASEVARTL
jgi:hypothetical protein